MEHRCTICLETELSVLGRLWLVRWPPRAWNVGNWRLHVLHSKTPTAALGSLWVFAVVSPQESDSSSSASSSSALELFMYWDGDDKALHPNVYLRRVDSVLLQSEAKKERRYVDIDIEISTAAMFAREAFAGSGPCALARSSRGLLGTE
ncbi:hypothetical protein BHM03_00029881 [Ensete ventricosum]|nr:hypothetical protein BHM03_00029881 [Ensete ventricosum]